MFDQKYSMDPRMIAKVVSEAPDGDSNYTNCPGCQNSFASIVGNDVACLNTTCQHYSADYREALQGMVRGGVTQGVLRTKRGVDIPFINIIDQGHYYAVYIPGQRREGYYTRAYYWPKYDEFVEREDIWPYTGIAGAPGAKGAQKLTYQAKTITIKKENVEYIK